MPRVGVLVLLTLIPLSLQRGWAQDEGLKRDFAERFTSIRVDNPNGVTEVRIWGETTIRVVASRQDGPVLESEVSIERRQERLRISIRPREAMAPLTLALYVPSSISLSVRSVTGGITVTGALAGLSIDTESGPVVLRLHESSNTDLSVRAVEGTIEPKVPMKIFGESDAHILDGRIGEGGSAVIVRSTRGRVSVLPDTGDRSEGAGRAQKRGAGIESTRGKSKRTSDARLYDGEAGIGVSEDAIKLEARLVNLNVKVTDSGGRTLPALNKQDFIVYEDGIRQEVSYFEPVTAPLHIVLLLDLSGSTEKKMKVMKRAAQKFVDSLKPADSMAVAAFTRRFFIISNFTTNHKMLKDRIDDIKNRHAGTAYYDAMWDTLDLLREAQTSRKAVVVLTDGVDNSLSNPDESEFDPKHGFEELLARVEEADVTIYPIYLDTEYETIGRSGRSGHDAYVTARKQLEALADQTGAVMFKAERAEDLEGVYQQVAAELHSLYSIAYAPKIVRKDGAWKKIGVTVNLPGAKIRAKRGYYAR